MLFMYVPNKDRIMEQALDGVMETYSQEEKADGYFRDPINIYELEFAIEKKLIIIESLITKFA